MVALSIRAYSQDAIHYIQLSEKMDINPICNAKADSIFKTFLTSKAFDWTDRKNNCEDRANAICLILDKWGVSNGKAWLFGGKNASYGNKLGTLKGWSYHVAACIFVRQDNGQIDTLVIDPLTDSEKAVNIRSWSSLITRNPTNIYFITSNAKYQQNMVSLTPTWKFSNDFYEETIEGLTRYNNFSIWTRVKTKKYLKKNLKKVKSEFISLLNTPIQNITSINCH